MFTDKRRFIALLAAVWILGSASPAHADLLLVPQRIVFATQDRTAILTLLNSGDEATSYRISWKQLRQLSDGRYEDVDKPRPDEHFADDMIRYSPRQVTLQPGEQQVVRLMLRKPPDLADGEYRSHLTFTAEPKVVGGPNGGRGIGVQLSVVYGVSIPVIVRQGELTATAALSVASKRTDKGYDVVATIKRAGTASLYGDILVDYLPPGGGTAEVDKIQGVSVLVPNPERTVTIAVPAATIQRKPGGQIRVSYKATDEDGGAMLGQAQATVN